MKKSWKGCGTESNGRLPGSGVGILCWRQLLLSHFSRVWLGATPQTTAHQVPLSPGFSRQEYWRGLPFPSPVHESEKWKWSCSVVSDPQWPHGPQLSRLLHPWDFPGKSTGVGCHCNWEPLKNFKQGMIRSDVSLLGLSDGDELFLFWESETVLAPLRH